MGSLFSKKKNNSVSQHDKAVLDLKVQRDKMKQYTKGCEAVLTKETDVAKSLLKQGKKKQALLALKKKKYQEVLLAKIETQLSNLQEMIDSIEFAQIQQKVFEGLKSGNEVLKELHSQMSLEEIDNLMMDTEEAIEYQKQIEDALGGKFSAEDDESILDELEQLEKETETSPEMPDVPTDEIPTEATPAKEKPKKKEASLVPG